MFGYKCGLVGDFKSQFYPFPHLTHPTKQPHTQNPLTNPLNSFPPSTFPSYQTYPSSNFLEKRKGNFYLALLALRNFNFWIRYFSHYQLNSDHFKIIITWKVENTNSKWKHLLNRDWYRTMCYHSSACTHWQMKLFANSMII